MKFLTQVAEGIYYLDHRLTPEVRAMLCAMASRMPTGGIEARYAEVIEAVAEALHTAEGADLIAKNPEESWAACLERAAGNYEPSTDPKWKKSGTIEERRERGIEGAKAWLASCRHRAEERFCVYPLHPKVQAFFDRFVKMYGHCYDDQTEVLCQDGGSGLVRWMFWKDAVRWHQSTAPDGPNEVSLRLAAFDPATDSVRFEKPSAWVVKPYRGEMYRVKKERGNIDLLVTPEHTMLVSKRGYVGGGRKNSTYEWSEWHGAKAQDVAGKTTYRYKRGAARLADVREITKNEDPWGLSLVGLNAFGRLCGFFVGDGYAGGRQASYLSFNIRKDREQAFLTTFEAELGLKVIRDKNGRCHVSLPGARDWARRFFYHSTATVPSGKPAKDIPPWVLLAPEEFVRGFLDGLHHSDGSTQTENSWSFANSSDPVTEGLQILGTLWDCPVSIRGPYQEGGSKVSFVSGPKCKEPVINRNSKEDGWEEYDGMIYCATVSTGFLIVRRNHATMVSGNSSVMELTGSPSVYVEGVSWWTAYRSFDNPLVSGQEFSTRAVRRKDWPMARECYDGTPRRVMSQKCVDDGILVTYADGGTEVREQDHMDLDPNKDLSPNGIFKILHDGWFEIFEAELEWWRNEFQSPCPVCEGKGSKADFGGAGLDRVCTACDGTGKKYPTADKEPFRPALDQARWAIPGTIATGFSHTANFRTMARVIRDGMLLAKQSRAPSVLKVWEDITKGYAAAVPGLAEMGLREAVYEENQDLDFHLHVTDLCQDHAPDDVVVDVHLTGDCIPPSVRGRKFGERVYLDPWFNNFGHVDFAVQCSLAVARDWHRHRTMMPWIMDIVWDADDQLQIHHKYGPRSEVGKAKFAEMLRLSTGAYKTFRDTGDQYRAMLCLPLGTKVRMSGQAGLRDMVYMLELRAFSHGASFEYSAQAKEALKQLVAALGPELSEKIGLTAP